MRTTGIHLRLLVLWALLICSCTSPLLPTPRLPREPRGDAALVEDLRRDWQLLAQVRMDEQERQAVISRYNARLLSLLRRMRYDIYRTYGKDSARYPLMCKIEHEGLQASRKLRDVYDDIVPAADVRTHELEEHYIVPGLGVPLVGVIPASKIRKSDHLVHFQSRGTVSTLTALLEFPANSQPVLKLIPRHWHERVRVGKLSYPLAGDFSAPIEIYWNLTNIRRGRFLGLLNPQKLRDTTGLTCIEQYNPNKIPVILTHGLASSAETFNNLVNRLQSDPRIRHHYQFWYFNYPTGVAWAVSAAEYHKALQAARQHFDPHRRNANWDRMVLVGHSMGGLITHLNQTLPPQQAATAHSRESASSAGLMKQLYDFKPIRAGQIVYMATPHRGAPIARNRFVLFLNRLVQLPQALVEEVFSIATLQEDTALTNPRRITQWFTSIGQLSPSSSDIIALNRRTVQNIPTHSIIGDRGRHNTPRSSDGIVPYWSSHIPWGTETIVPADHSVQDTPETAADLKRLLLQHLNSPK